MMKDNKHSHINADAEQTRLLEIERAAAEKGNAHNIFLIVIFFAFIFAFAVAFWALPDREMSSEEKRSLQGFPSADISSVISGKFTSEFSDYMADQFPLRNFFVGMKASCERAMLKGQNNGVMIGDDGYLVKRFDKIDEDILENNLRSASVFRDAAEKNGIGVTFAFAGRTLDTASSKVPKIYGTHASDEAWEKLDGACRELEIDYVDLKTPLREKLDNGEYVYYRTDHHWTSLGAFYAYNEIAEAMGLPVYERGDFTEETASDEFLGTTYSSAGIKDVAADTITLFRYDGDDELIRTSNLSDENLSLYDRDALDTTDKYNVFIGGNAAEVHITDNTGERECILLVKDSFSHSVAPFLAREYDLEIIDLRYFSGSLLDVCREYGITKAILMYNMETLSSESGFRMFKAVASEGEN